MSNTKKNKKPGNKLIIGIVVAVLVITAIWFQSCFSVKDSTVESRWFLNLTKSVLEPLFGPLQIDGNGIRKVAHVIEFFILGTAISVIMLSDKITLIKFLPANRKVLYYVLRVFICIAIVFVVACTDEFIQIFSGRGSRVSDVVLDCIAGTTAFLVVWIVKLIIARVKNRRNNPVKTNDKNNNQ